MLPACPHTAAEGSLHWFLVDLGGFPSATPSIRNRERTELTDPPPRSPWTPASCRPPTDSGAWPLAAAGCPRPGPGFQQRLGKTCGGSTWHRGEGGASRPAPCVSWVEPAPATRSSALCRPGAGTAVRGAGVQSSRTGRRHPPFPRGGGSPLAQCPALGPSPVRGRALLTPCECSFPTLSGQGCFIF